MPFVQKDIAVRTSNGRDISTLEILQYIHGDGTVTTIPVGSTSDGGSEPQLVWSLGFCPNGRPGWFAFVLHDYLYRRTWLPRDYCDSVLLEALISCGEPKEWATIVYDAVRLGGGAAFAADRAALELEEAKRRNGQSLEP